MKQYISIQKLTAMAFALILSYQCAQASDRDLYEGEDASTNKQSISVDPYQEALNFRDNKVPGYSPEESMEKAETLFLQLAEAGNSKAMHNYAVIQYKKGDYDLAYQWFGKSDLDASQRNTQGMLERGEIKQDLYLVVNSKRFQGWTSGSCIDQIYGHSDSDLTHTKTFDGQATTLDTCDAKLPGSKHIKGDATQFDFSKRYIIKKVLIEKFPTLMQSSSNLVISNPLPEKRRDIVEINYMGLCIEQIKKAMEPGTKIEIEWLPYLSLDSGITDFSKHIANNPFTGFFNMNIALQSIFILGGDTNNINILPKDMVSGTLDLKEKVKKYLTFYHEQGAGKSTEDLIQLVYYEARVLQDFFRTDSMVLLDYKFFLQDPEKLKAAYKSKVFGIFPNQFIGKRGGIQNASGILQHGIVYDRAFFQKGTLVNFLLTDIAAEYNAPQVEQYMKSVGFKDILIQKGTNPHTRRKNVWMINATKS